MLSKNKIKLIHSLEKKKNRTEEGLFVAEGPKMMEELLPKWQPVFLASTEDWAKENEHLMRSVQEQAGKTEMELITQAELERASLMRTPQQVLALFPIPKSEEKLADVADRELCLALDNVQDPGNVGTIIRLADWFGISHVFCNMETADIYAPEAVQATMGAISRVHVHYINLYDELLQSHAPKYGTHLDGENIYGKTLTNHGTIIMGNEGKGISEKIESLVDNKLYIPPFPADRDKVESLNVAIATAIVCAEFRRRN